MKNRKTVFTVTVLALAFALAPGTEAARQPEGGPAHQSSTARGNASSEAGAQLGMPENILPLASIRLNLINMDVANGITVSCRFIDAGGVTLAQSVITLSLGKIASVDFKRGDPLPGESPELLRAEVRAQIDIFTDGASSDSLRSSLEVFNNDSGATTVYMGGAGS